MLDATNSRALDRNLPNLNPHSTRVNKTWAITLLSPILLSARSAKILFTVYIATLLDGFQKPFFDVEIRNRQALR